MSKIETEIKDAVKQNWADFAKDIKDPAARQRFSVALADFTQLTVTVTTQPARAAELAPEIKLARSTLASLAALSAQKARKAAQKTAMDVGAILLKVLTVAIAGA